MDVRIEPLDLRHAPVLARILDEDDRLVAALGSRRSPESPQQFLDRYTAWQQRTNSATYAITKDATVVGVISLSHRDDREHAARIGYWIASGEWGKGIGSRAFALLLAIGRAAGYTVFRTSMSRGNVASVRIWQKHGAVVRDHGGRSCVEIRPSQ